MSDFCFTRLKLVLFLLVSFFCGFTQAQRLNVNQIDRSVDLPSRMLTQVEHLSSGYLLFSSDAGAYLFDGYRAIPLVPATTKHANALNSQIYDTLEDSNGNIWFATAVGLYNLKSGTSELVEFAHEPNNPNSLVNTHVRRILEDSQGNLWFGTLNGLSRYNPSKQRFTNYRRYMGQSSQQSLGQAFVLMEEPNFGIWYGTNAGLFLVNPSTNQLVKQLGVLKDSYITSGFISDKKELWFGIDQGGIVKIEPISRKTTSIKTGSRGPIKLKNNDIWALKQDSKGFIWIGYWNSGVSVYNPHQQTTHSIDYHASNKNALPGASITSFTQDDAGLIWISSNDGAVWFDHESLKIDYFSDNYSIDTPADKVEIVSVIEDNNGVVWMGTEQGLIKWNTQTGEHHQTRHDPADSESISKGHIWKVYPVDDLHLLLATARGIDFYNKITNKAVHFDHLTTRSGSAIENPFYAILRRDENQFYVSSSASTIHILDPFKGTVELLFDAMDNPLTEDAEYFSVLFKDNQGHLWLGSTSGLYRLNVSDNSVIGFNATQSENSLSGNVIYDIIQDQQSRLWVATSSGGINLIDTESGTVNYLTQSDGLPSNSILNLVTDQLGQIWFTSRSKVGVIDPQTLDVQTYPALSSQDLFFSEGAATINSQGKILFAGHELIRFKPNAIKTSQFQPNIKISAISKMHQPLEDFNPLKNSRTVEVYPEDSLLSFEFTSLDYSANRSSQYRYQLLGFDNDWLLPGKQHRATYTHLPHGNYKFVVQGTNRDGLWSNNTAQVDLVVHSTVWQTWYAYVSYSVLFLSTLLMLFIAQRNRRAKEQANLKAIQLSESRLKNVLWGSGDEFWRWNLNTNQVTRTTSHAIDEETSERSVSYESLMIDIHPDDRIVIQEMIDCHLRGEQSSYEAQFRLYDEKTESWQWRMSRGRIVERDENGKPLILAGATKDIDELKKTEKQLRYLANYDQLTKLPNRALFNEHLGHALKLAERFQEKLAVLFFDLNGFKMINDTLGHGVGDQLLQNVSSRLKDALRDVDSFARLGGDEFGLLIERPSDINSIKPSINRIIEELSVPFELNGHSVVVSVSIGVAVYPEDGTRASSLLKHADIAMYEAKKVGAKNYCFFKREMNANLINRLDMEKQIENALANNELETYYQPRVSVNNNQLVGYEALVRWRHPERGLVSPAEFIPVAEETGQILDIGFWVLNDACRQMARWRSNGWEICVSINIAALQFQKSDLVSNVRKAIEYSGLDPSALELEITEGTLINNIEHTREVILKLKNIGVRIALDDFGTGYSSLAYLQQLPIDVLKIDRSFVNQILHSKKSAKLSKAIINMAHSLELEVVAEGIEEQAQLDFLKETGCEEYQGYLFGKPQPVEEIEKNRLVE